MRSGKHPPGARFLTEREIARRFDTSRPTANKALSSLVSEGILEVRRGAGTFVKPGALDYNLERLVSFTDKASSAGMKPGTKLLKYTKIQGSDVSDAVQEALKLEANSPVIYMERIRMADGKPVIYERRHVFATLCPAMTRQDAKGSLYECWTRKCRLAIVGAEETIRAMNASKEQGLLLGIPAGSACFQITATGFCKDERPLWHEVTIYRADVYEFRNRIGGISPAHAAIGRIIT